MSPYSDGWFGGPLKSSMIDRFFIAAFDYFRFTFGVMLAATAVFAIISLGVADPHRVIEVTSSFILLKIAWDALDRAAAKRVTINLASLPLGERLLVSVVSVFASPGFIMRLLNSLSVHHSKSDPI